MRYKQAKRILSEIIGHTGLDTEMLQTAMQLADVAARIKLGPYPRQSIELSLWRQASDPQATPEIRLKALGRLLVISDDLLGRPTVNPLDGPVRSKKPRENSKRPKQGRGKAPGKKKRRRTHQRPESVRETETPAESEGRIDAPLAPQEKPEPAESLEKLGPPGQLDSHYQERLKEILSSTGDPVSLEELNDLLEVDLLKSLGMTESQEEQLRRMATDMLAQRREAARVETYRYEITPSGQILEMSDLETLEDLEARWKGAIDACPRDHKEDDPWCICCRGFRDEYHELLDPDPTSALAEVLPQVWDRIEEYSKKHKAVKGPDPLVHAIESLNSTLAKGAAPSWQGRRRQRSG